MSDPLSHLVGDHSVRWHAQFVDNLHVGVYRTTVEGRFVFCNKTLAKTLGFSSSKELFEFPVANLYRNIQDRGKFIQKIIRDGRVDNYPLVLKKKDDSPATVSVSAGAVFDDEGLLVFIDGIVQKTSQASPEKDLAKKEKTSQRKTNLKRMHGIVWTGTHRKRKNSKGSRNWPVEFRTR